MSRLCSTGRSLVGFLTVATSIALLACSGRSSTAIPAASPTAAQSVPSSTSATATAAASASPTAAATAAAATATTAPSAAPAAAAKTTVNITLKEWAMTPDKSTAPAGQVTFHAQVAGAIPHELKVVKSDLALDVLPIKDSTVDESKVQVVGTVP